MSMVDYDATLRARDEEIERLRAELEAERNRLILGEAAHASVGSMLLDMQDECIKERQRAEAAARSMRERAADTVSEMIGDLLVAARVVAAINALPLIENKP